MSNPQLLNEPIIVKALLNGEQLYPETVRWQNRSYQVISIGRQWLDEQGTHVLLEVHDGSRMEVVLGHNLAWRLRYYWPTGTTV